MEETLYAIIKEYWIVAVLVMDFIVLFLAWAIGSTLRELDDKKNNMEVVTFEISQKLKVKGFNEPCYMYYHIHDNIEDSIASLECTGGDSDFINSYNRYRCAAPTISQVLNWLGDEKQIYILVEPFPSMATKDKVCWSWSLKWNSDGINIDHTFPDDFTYLTSKEAALAAIEYVFNNMI